MRKRVRAGRETDRRRESRPGIGPGGTTSTHPQNLAAGTHFFVEIDEKFCLIAFGV